MEDPRLPAYGAGCISDLMPVLLGLSEPSGSWFPTEVWEAERRVLVVLDGLGWDQLRAHAEWAPTLTRMTGGPITTVAPSTSSPGAPSSTRPITRHPSGTPSANAATSANTNPQWARPDAGRISGRSAYS